MGRANINILVTYRCHIHNSCSERTPVGSEIIVVELSLHYFLPNFWTALCLTPDNTVPPFYH